MAIWFCSFRNYLYGSAKAFDYLDAPIKRITTPDAPAPYSCVICRVVPEIRKSKKQEIKNVLYVKS